MACTLQYSQKTGSNARLLYHVFDNTSLSPIARHALFVYITSYAPRAHEDMAATAIYGKGDILSSRLPAHPSSVADEALP